MSKPYITVIFDVPDEEWRLETHQGSLPDEGEPSIQVEDGALRVVSYGVSRRPRGTLVIHHGYAELIDTHTSEWVLGVHAAQYPPYRALVRGSDGGLRGILVTQEPPTVSDYFSWLGFLTVFEDESYRLSPEALALIRARTTKSA
jgi:hypothetical protein